MPNFSAHFTGYLHMSLFSADQFSIICFIIHNVFLYIYSRISDRISSPVDQDTVRASMLKLAAEHNLDSAHLQSCSAESACADNSADNGIKRCMPKEFPVCKTKTNVIFPTNVTALNDKGNETLYLISQGDTSWQPVLTTECCPEAKEAYPFSCMTVYLHIRKQL
jgi:hypothetical protein